MSVTIDLGGRACLVVGGAGGGIGAEVARQAGEAGAIVALVTHNKGDANAMVEELRGRGVRSATAVADVTDEAALVDAIGGLQAEVGPIRHLVNVVGGAMGVYRGAADMDLEVFDRILAQNLRYVFVSCREVGRELKAAGRTGSMVNISSGASVGRPMLSAYSAAKAALESYSRAVALEWAPAGIRVNVVSSGMVRTARTSHLDTTEAVEAIPLRRQGMPEEVAYAVLFLLSDLASYTTGHTLDVDGGVGMGHPGGDQASSFLRR